MIDLIKKILSLNFPQDQYCVISGAVLAVHSIRSYTDIDLLITPSLFNKCQKENWKLNIYPDGFQSLSYDCFELMTVYSKKFTLKDISPIEIIKNVPFISLKQLIKWKKILGRPKDLADIALIDRYLLKNSSS